MRVGGARKKKEVIVGGYFFAKQLSLFAKDTPPPKSRFVFLFCRAPHTHQETPRSCIAGGFGFPHHRFFLFSPLAHSLFLSLGGVHFVKKLICFTKYTPPQ